MGRRQSRRVLGMVARWVALVAVWFLITGSVDLSEVVAGAVAALGGVAAEVVVRRQRLVRARFRLRWFRHVWRLSGRTVGDTVRVLAALVRHLVGRRVEGRFRSEPFRSGHGDEASARRALITAAWSLPPGTYVVGFDEDQGRVLLHEFPGER